MTVAGFPAGLPIPRLMGWALAVIWPLEVLRLLLPLPEWLTWGVSGLFLVYLLLAIATAHVAARTLSLALLAGTVALAWTDNAWAEAVAGFQGAMVFAAFLPSVFLLRHAFAGDRRLNAYRAEVAAASPERQKGLLLVGSHLLGSTLTVGAFAVLAPVVPPDATPARRSELAQAAIFGVCLSVIWSPAFVAMAVVSDFMPHLPLWKLVGLGMMLGTFGLALGFARVRTPGRLRLAGAGLWALRFIVPWVAVSAGAIIVASSLAGVSTLVAASLVLPPLAATLLLLQPRGNIGAALRLTRANLDRLGPEISIVALAFTLGAVMLASPTVSTAIGGVLGPELPAPLLVAGIVASMMGVVLIGGHPIVVASILLAVFASVRTGLDDLFVAAAVLLGWGCGAMMAPAGLIIIVSTGMFEVSRQSVILSRNALSAVVFAVLGIVILSALNAAFG